MNMPQFTIDRWLGGKKAAAALTFDDWTPGQALVALPLLDKIKLQATFFVTLSNFEIRPNEDHWWTLQQLKFTGHEVGNHTVHHSDLCTLSPTKLFAETTYAKELFDDQLLGKPVTTFAYPFGRYNETVINELKKSHVGARTYSDTNDNLKFNYNFAESDEDYFKIPSVRVNSHLSEHNLENLINEYITNNGFMTCVFHGVFNNTFANDKTMFDAIHEEKLVSLIQVMDKKRDCLWITTFGHAISYHRYVNSLDYQISIIREKLLRIDFAEGNATNNPSYISVCIGFYCDKYPISITHNGKLVPVDYTESGVRVLIDTKHIYEPVYVYYQ